MEVDGRDPFADRQRHVGRIGVVFGQRSQLWWDLPVGDGFNLLRDLYRVDPLRFARTRDELVAMLNLERLLDQPVRQLSLGQRMRAEIAAARCTSPRSCSWTSPPSAWTHPPSWPCATSCCAPTANAAPRCC